MSLEGFPCVALAATQKSFMTKDAGTWVHYGALPPDLWNGGTGDLTCHYHK